MIHLCEREQRSSQNKYSMSSSAIDELASNPDIIITDADKNMGTVVISTSDYIKFANKHLVDALTYRLCQSFPTERLLACWK